MPNNKGFDAVTRGMAAAQARRDIVKNLIGAGLGLAGMRLAASVEAKKKRKKKPRPNAFGCRDVGKTCKSAAQCCSGICEGKPGRRKCRPHDAGGCSAGACGAEAVPCTTSFLEPGICGTTTGNAGYCYPGTAGSECFACSTDAECQEANGGIWGPYAACLRCTDCPETGGTACAAPFSSPL